MGNSSSTDGENDDEALLDPFDGADTLGYRVLGVQPDSPASKAGLVSFLDFLVGANGEMLLASGENVEHGEEYPDVDLPKLLQENKGKPVEFLVWNMKSQQARLVELVPGDWGGVGLLGVTIRLDNYAGAEERLVRVLEVESPQSPAAMAGLVPYNDYILGTTSETLQDTAQLANLLEENIDRVVELYVYNSQSDLVRNVALMPTLSWGGPGLLGAAVGTGYLHRFPAKVQETNGASVERKVRYIGTSPSNPSSYNISSSSKTELRIELEPQLEMEVPSDSESDVETEEPQSRKTSSRDLSLVMKSEKSKSDEQGGISNQSKKSTNDQDRSDATSTENQPPCTVSSCDSSVASAAALFAGPPPTSQSI